MWAKAVPFVPFGEKANRECAEAVPTRDFVWITRNDGPGRPMLNPVAQLLMCRGSVQRGGEKRKLVRRLSMQASLTRTYRSGLFYLLYALSFPQSKIEIKVITSGFEGGRQSRPAIPAERRRSTPASQSREGPSSVAQ